MKSKRKLSLIIVALLAFSLSVSAVHATKYYRNTDYYLSIPNSNVFLNFDEFRDFDDFFPDNGTGTLFFDLPEEYTVSSLSFSGENCNTTITDLGENNKLYVADVAGASSDSSVNFTLDYGLPYLQTIEGAVTNVDVDGFESNMLTWSVDGDGPCAMRVHYPTGQTSYYLKINGVVKVEGDSWSASGNTVTVTDTLGSLHDYELGFTGLPQPPVTNPPSGQDDDDLLETGEFVMDIIGSGTDFVLANWMWIGFFLVVFVLVCAAVLAKKREDWT